MIGTQELFDEQVNAIISDRTTNYSLGYMEEATIPSDFIVDRNIFSLQQIPIEFLF